MEKEIYFLEAVLQRIQWERGYIQLNPLPVDSITGPLSGSAPVSQSVQPQKNAERDLEKAGRNEFQEG